MILRRVEESLIGQRKSNMGAHMKTTIEICDNLLARAKSRALEQKTTLRALIEKSLAATLDQPVGTPKVKPVTFKGKGLQAEFADSGWDKIRDAIYE